MKKTILLILLFCLAYCCVACEKTQYPSSSSTTPNTTNCSHSWENATCTSPKTCSMCGKTSGSALGHTTSTGTCSRCGINFSSWEQGEYVDEFKQPTGKKYLFCDSTGTFSNSATTNSKLSVALQVDLDDIGIMMLEYGNILVKGIYDSEDYSITILDDDNVKYYYTGTIYKGGIRIYFKNADEGSVLNLLKNNSQLQFYIKSTKYSISTYLFSINTVGFTAAYESLLG